MPLSNIRVPFYALLVASSLAFCSTSCKSLEPAVALPAQVELSSSNLNELAGEYEILSSPLTSSFLDEILLFRNDFNLEKRPGPEDRIRIEIVGPTTLRATLLTGSKAIKTKTIRGRYEDGYFRFRHSRLIPFLAVNLYRRIEVRMTVLENGNLRVDDASTGLAFLLFFPVIGGGDNNEQVIFRKFR